MVSLDINRLRREIEGCDLWQVVGKLRSAKGQLTCALPVAVGEQCEIAGSHGRSMLAEVIGFGHGVAHLMPYERTQSFAPGMPVVRVGPGLTVHVGPGLLGRVLDGLGRPLDGRGPVRDCECRALHARSPAPMERARIVQPFVTGQRAIDGMLTCGLGQRIGLFAGSGVGKSILLGEIAKGSEANVNVIALIGERGREVRPFIEDCLGPKGLERSVVIVATSDQTPLMRVRSAEVAIAMADYYREQGLRVLFLLDSVTRLAMAQREMGLALGEPPSARGYTPSVFQMLATTVERLGNSAHGSITGLLTVLVDGDDLNEPISDAVRSLVNGHIVLDRRLAERSHFPAIDISRSISRLAHEVVDDAHKAAARKVRAILATYAEVEDLIRIGAYAKGTSPQVDRAIALAPVVETFLKQNMGERTSFAETKTALGRIADAWPF